MTDKQVLTSDQIRKLWLDFWESKQHTSYAPSPVFPHEDKTLLFTNAGMVQFKPIFLGTVDPNDPRAQLQRASNSQKCIRAGGKHNDLDDVGNDSYHHTFFEMLGSWSFNSSYFKKEAIEWGWEFMINHLHLDPNRMYVTYYKGDDKVGIPMDTVTRDTWAQFIPKERILPFLKDNFWEMGEVGPCGVCTEIHYDLQGGRDATHLVNGDDPTCIEIWNMVFISFNREADKSLTKLPNVHVDTGMGFERITSILQGKTSNYDTDIFFEIFEEIKKLTGARAYTGKFKDEDKDKIDVAYRIVADHVRTSCIAIGDGVLPGTDGRNYIVRRILRRSIRFSKVSFNCPQLTSQLVPVVVQKLKGYFPELEQKQQRIISIIQSEEKHFLKLLEAGNLELDKFFEGFKDKKKVVPGDFIWKLYSLRGFPHDIVKIAAEEKGFAIDLQGFEKLKKIQSDKDRDNRKKATSLLSLQASETNTLGKTMNIPTTDVSLKYSNNSKASATILAIWDGKQFLQSAEWDDNNDDTAILGLILDQTNFYAEQGGQVADIGTIQREGAGFAVQDVQLYAGYVLHIGQIEFGSLKVNENVDLEYEDERRKLIMNNHTSTHILNFALRDVLGDSIDQKGSLVDNEKLRFDFSWDENISNQQFEEIQNRCTTIINKNLPIYTKVASFKEAKQINTLRAVFGETYPDPVIVVSVGVPVEDLLKDPTNPEWMKYSVEFCGGTHIPATGVIKDFSVTSYSSVGSGTKRIIAVTGELVREVRNNAAALKQMIEQSSKAPLYQKEDILSKLNVKLNTLLLPILDRRFLEDKRDELVKIILQEKKDITSKFENEIEKIKQEVQNKPTSFVVLEVDVASDKKVLSQGTKILTKECPNTAFLIFFPEGPKMCYQAIVPKPLTKKCQAVDLVKFINDITKGKGGGKDLNALGSCEQDSFAKDLVQQVTDFGNKKF